MTGQHAEPSGGWRTFAACSTKVEMVPDAETPDVVCTAKRVCSGCPVRRRCQQAAAALGEPDGVWGGLTRVERYRRSARPDQPATELPCARCALPCIPAQPDGDVCDSCLATTHAEPNAERQAEIAAHLRAGRSYRQIGADLGVSAGQVRAACRRWGLPSRRPARESDQDLEQCGTASARRRHQRRGEPVCAACRAADRRASAERRAHRGGVAAGLDHALPQQTHTEPMEATHAPIPVGADPRRPSGLEFRDPGRRGRAHSPPTPGPRLHQRPPARPRLRTDTTADRERDRARLGRHREPPT